jgi:hypothetical protein
MFIETHNDNNIALTFLQSEEVKVYPCGRRRSTSADKDGNANTPNDKYYFPFDPEARLNTEANNRKHSGLNGFTQNYLKEWKNSNFTLALEGYLFNISSSYTNAANFGQATIDTLKNKTLHTSEWNIVNNTTKIYANILLEEVPLFSGFVDYYSSILRNQSAGAPETSLDLLKENGTLAESQDYHNYYFSGLSFSATPLTAIAGGENYIAKTRDSLPYSTERDQKPINQRIVSLCILEKAKVSADGVIPEVWEWQIHKPAYLPKIAHGTTKDSVVLGDTRIERRLDDAHNIITEGNITVDNKVITKDLDASGVITATEELENDADNIVARKANVTSLLTATEADLESADIAMLTGDTATITTINGDDIQQKIGEGDDADYYNVPVMFIKKDGDKYQLQLSRVNKVDF